MLKERETYTATRGVENEGYEFEVAMLCFYCFHLCYNEDIQDFKIAIYDEMYHPFDDIVIEIATEVREKYAIQLKHVKDKLVMNVNHFGKNGKMVLNKYFKFDFSKSDHVVLLTNGVVNEEIIVGNCSIKLKTTLTTMEKALDTSEEKANHIFVICDEETSNKVTFYTAQKNRVDVDRTIAEEFKKKFHLDDRTVGVAIQKLKAFFQQWKKGCFGLCKLDKRDIKMKIAEILFDESIVELEPHFVNRGSVLRQVLTTSSVTIGRDINTADINKLCYFDLDKEKLLSDGSNLLILANGSGYKEMVTILWRLNRFPLVVTVNSGNQATICELISNLHDENLSFLLLGEVSRLGFAPLRVFETLRDLQNGQLYEEVVQEFEVSIQGQPKVTLKQLVDCNPNFCDIFTLKELLSMVDEDFRVGEAEDDLPQPYIKRRVLTTIVKVSTLKQFPNDVFAISGNPKTLKRKLPNYKFWNFKQFSDDSFLGNRLPPKSIVLCENEHFPACLKYKNSNVHCFRLVDEEHLQLIYSKEKSAKLKKFQVLPEDQLHCLLKNNINLICARPGMGKLTMLKFLRKNCPPGFWTIKVDLQEEHRDHFDNDGSFAAKVRNCFREVRRVIFFFHGIDNLQNASLLKATKRIQKLANDNYKVWVFSEDYLKETLEKTFQVSAMEIEEFSEEEQQLYIHERLKDRPVDQVFANLKMLKNSDILGAPMHLYMLTEIFINNPETKMEEMFILNNIYQYFIKTKYHHYLSKVSAESHNQIIDDGIFYRNEQYKLAAISSLNFNVVQCDTYFVKQIERIGDVIGIISKIGNDGTIIFSQETYADYFAALWLSSNYRKVEMKNFVFQEVFKNIFFMFNLEVCKDCPAHVAVLYQDYHQLLKYEGHFNDLDCLGRSTLHLACCTNGKFVELQVKKEDKVSKFETKEGIKEDKEVKRIINHLVDNITFDPLQTDSLLNWNILDYAFNTLNLHAVEKTISKYRQVSGYIFGKLRHFPHDYLFTIIYYSVKFGYRNLLELASNLDSFTNVLAFENSNGENLLHLAVKTANASIVKILLTKGSKVDSLTSTYNKRSPLHLAVESDHSGIVEMLLRHGARVDIMDRYRDTPLHLASRRGDLNSAKFLLQYGADINFADNLGRTALQFAAANGHVQIIKLLLDKGVQVDKCDRLGNSPLTRAKNKNYERIVDLLSEKGAKASNSGLRRLPSTEFDEYTTHPLHWVCFTGQPERIDSLLQDGCSINGRDQLGRTPLCRAVHEGYSEIVEMLVERGADANIPDANGIVPLCGTISKGDSDMISLLLNSDANIDVKDNFGYSPLHWAAFIGNTDIVKLLLTKNPDVEAVDNFGRRVIDCAVENGHFETVAILDQDKSKNEVAQLRSTFLAHYKSIGEKMNAPTQLTPFLESINNGTSSLVKKFLKQGPTQQELDDSLYRAVFKQHGEIVELLLAKGADVNTTDGCGVSLLHLAAFNDSSQIATLLLKRGARATVVDHFGYGPLEVAAMEGRHGTVAVLVQNGGCCGVADKCGNTALDWACKKGHEKCVEVLMENGGVANTCQGDCLETVKKQHNFLKVAALY